MKFLGPTLLKLIKRVYNKRSMQDTSFEVIQNHSPEHHISVGSINGFIELRVDGLNGLGLDNITARLPVYHGAVLRSQPEVAKEIFDGTKEVPLDLQGRITVSRHFINLALGRPNEPPPTEVPSSCDRTKRYGFEELSAHMEQNKKTS